MWFQDLTPYAYLHSDRSEPALNVGWLERGRPFPLGVAVELECGDCGTSYSRSWLREA